MNVKMVQNAFHLVQSMNAGAKMMAILGSIVKIVTFILKSLKPKNKNLKLTYSIILI